MESKMDFRKTWNKSAMSISVVFLVALTLILCVITIYYFAISQNARSTTLNIPTQLDYIYSDSDYFNFHFENAFHRTIQGFNPSDGPGVFITKLRDELNKTQFFSSANSYIQYGPMSESSVQILSYKIILNLDVDVTSPDSSQGLNIKYSYTKKFEEKLN